MEELENIKTLFLSFLEGESLSDAQFESLGSWFREHHEAANNFRQLMDIWNLGSKLSLAGEKEIEREWTRFKTSIEHRQKIRRSAFSSYPRWLRVAGMAASVLLISGLSILVFNMFQDRHILPFSQQSVVVPFGSTSTIILSDGTEVTLNAGSRLSYRNDFGRNTREVYLEGEGYFKVAHNPARVFAVKTSHVVVKAYGTIFNVKAYPEESSIEATLIEGSISVSSIRRPQAKLYLKPLEQVIYYKPSENNKGETAKNERMILSKSVDPVLYTSWTGGRLKLQSELLQSLAVKLERKYDIKIHFDNQNLKNMRFTGTLENETLEQVLNAIRFSSDIDFRVKGRDVWLFSQARK